MNGNGHRQDVEIHVPTARVGLAAIAPGQTMDAKPEELLSAYIVDNDRLRRDLRTLGETTTSISLIALSLLKLLFDKGYGTDTNEVRIPIDLYRQMNGATSHLRKDLAGDIYLRLEYRDHSGEATENGN